MLKNLQEIMGGDVTHALVRLWSDQLSEAEAAAIHSRGQGDPNYRDELDELLAVFDSIERLVGDLAMEEIAWEYRCQLRERRTKLCLTLAMAAGFLIALGAILAVFSLGPDDYHLEKHVTRVGEQQTIELDDGSVVRLNTAGQLVVDYSGPARRVLLERGEAFFEVADDPERSFTVDLGLHSVTAVGTEFNVRKDPERYQVAVIEGAVAFHAVTDEVSAPPPPVSIAGPGPRSVEQGWVAEFDVSGEELTAFQPASMDRYHDWRNGLLSFSREPLFQVIQELNRYSRKKILIEDASVMKLSVLSVLRVTDIDTALHGLEQALPIEVTSHYDRIVITASVGDDNEHHDP